MGGSVGIEGSPNTGTLGGYLRLFLTQADAVLDGPDHSLPFFLFLFLFLLHTTHTSTT